jgi:hypothetical protein
MIEKTPGRSFFFAGEAIKAGTRVVQRTNPESGKWMGENYPVAF